MFNFLDKISYQQLTVVAIIMVLAPFSPMPHAVEKIIMLSRGSLTKPIDIFDLCFHLFPTILILIKMVKKPAAKPESE